MRHPSAPGTSLTSIRAESTRKTPRGAPLGVLPSACLHQVVNRPGLAAGLGTAFLDHIRAHADFNAVAREIMELVRLIDGLNTVRLKDQPKLLAEWQAAKSVFGSARTKPDDPADAGAATPGATEVAA